MTKERPLELAIGRIDRFEIRQILEKGQEHSVNVKISGKGNYIFLTLMLVNPNNKDEWWPDNDTLDLVKNGGKLELIDLPYQRTWYFPFLNKQ